MKFYLCERCGNLFTKIIEKACTPFCCGQETTELIPNSTEANVEAHTPVYEVADGIVTVKVGAKTHPMLEEHYIQWVALETNQGTQVKKLEPGHEPVSVFALASEEKVVAVYAYCNLHRLWKSE